MYIRVTQDKGNAYETAQQVFGNIRRLTRNNATANECAFVTDEMSIKELRAKISQLTDNGVNVLNSIRIGDL